MIPPVPPEETQSFTDLVKAAKDYQASQAQRRRRSWTRETATVAKRYGAIPLTVGGAIGLFIGLMKFWAFSAEMEEHTRVKVERAIIAHTKSNEAHKTELGKAQQLNERTWEQVVKLQVELSELRNKVLELHETPRRRRRK